MIKRAKPLTRMDTGVGTGVGAGAHVVVVIVVVISIMRSAFFFPQKMQWRAG